MKNLKFCSIALLSLLALSCQKEELETAEIQDSQLEVEYFPGKFTLPENFSKMSSQDVEHEIFTSEPPISAACSYYRVVWPNTTASGYHVYLNSLTNYNYFGGYITGEGTTIIKVMTSLGTIYEKTITTNEEFYFGVSIESTAAIEISTIYGSGNTITIREGTIGTCNFTSSDLDGDGCLDENDSIIESNMEETVVLHGCDSEVENRNTSACGVMMSDLIDQLEVGTYRNHGGFVKEVAQLTETWLLEGLITQEEKDAIVSCAGQSN